MTFKKYIGTVIVVTRIFKFKLRLEWKIFFNRTLKIFQKESENMNGNKNEASALVEIEKGLHISVLENISDRVRTMTFEKFLQGMFTFCPEVTPDFIFDRTIFDTLLAVEYGFQENDTEILNLARTLPDKLEKGEGLLDRLFGCLLKKALYLGQCEYLSGRNRKHI